MKYKKISDMLLDASKNEITNQYFPCDIIVYESINSSYFNHNKLPQFTENNNNRNTQQIITNSDNDNNMPKINANNVYNEGSVFRRRLQSFDYNDKVFTLGLGNAVRRSAAQGARFGTEIIDLQTLIWNEALVSLFFSLFFLFSLFF